MNNELKKFSSAGSIAAAPELSDWLASTAQRQLTNAVENTRTMLLSHEAMRKTHYDAVSETFLRYLQRLSEVACKAQLDAIDESADQAYGYNAATRTF